MTDTIINIAIGCDHAGFKTKEYIKQRLNQIGCFVQDFGAFSEESMDYPDSAHPLSREVQIGTYKFGILICGSGNGMAMVANKYKGIRAAICWNESTTLLARKHNDANILALPARFITQEKAADFSVLFVTTEFEGGRHACRVEKIDKTM